MKRVFVLSRRSLFHRGIETLLSQTEGLKIVGQETEPEAAAECIETLCPDVIIVNLDDPETDLSPPVICILRNRLDVRIIGLSLQDNEISIYQGKNKQIRQLDDLLNAILD